MIINLTAPTQWGELTLEQVRMVVKTMLLLLTESERLLVLLCQLTGIRIYGEPSGGKTELFVTDEGQAFTMQDYEIEDFCNRLRWLIDDIEPDDLPNPTKRDDYLRDISFGDWFEADTQFRLYEDDGDLAHFDIILPKLANEVRQVTQSEATVLHLWWNSVMAQIAPMYPNVFNKQEVGGGECNPFKSLQEMHLLLNDDHPQDNEKIDNARLHDVLSALDSKIEKLKIREAEYNKIVHP